MTQDQAIQRLVEHHLKLRSVGSLNGLEYKAFQKELKRRYSNAGFGTKGFYVDYRFDNKVLIKIDEVGFCFPFNEFVSRFYDELNCQQLVLF